MKARNETDMCIACQCAPVLAGLKTSNIFMAKGIAEKQLEESARICIWFTGRTDFNGRS